MTFRVVGATLALAAAAAILWAWTGIGALVGGTVFRDYRYVILVAGTLLGLSVLDSLLARIGRWLEKPGKETDPDAH